MTVAGGETHPDRHELIRRHNESRILAAIDDADGPISRVGVATALGLSKPTVNAVIDDLCSTGILREAGIRTGGVGRPAALVEINPDAAMALALAFDATGLTAAVADITGEVRALVEAELPKPDRLARTARELSDRALTAAGVSADAIRSTCISAPGVVHLESGRRALADNLPGLDDAELISIFEEAYAGPATIENDVNLAAIGEHRFGSASAARDFVFLLIDTGVGMGLMVNGELLRGSRGLAGEAGYLPIGADTLDSRAVRVGAFESAAGRQALQRAYREALAAAGSARPRADLDDLFLAAEGGDPIAVSVIRREADLIARGVLAAAVLIDPQFVVLGGRIGGHPFVIDEVTARLARLAPYPIEVRASALEGRAPVMGALARSLAGARSALGLPA
jgi:predicted NBD/HSP70 family sugar kinase